MEILTTAECFPLDPDQPIFTVVVFSHNEQIFIGRANGRCGSKANIDLEELEDVVELDKTEFQPQYLDGYTRAKPTDQLYIKRPNLLSYYPINDTDKKRIADEILQEVQVFERFRRNPHPNIAEYLGCEVTDGKISGIWFKQYKHSL